jgi:predicted metal-dependent hydrolase
MKELTPVVPVVSKFDRLEVFVRELDRGDHVTADLHPCYLGYFTCFNRGDYYEAHDVLEHLWLQDPGADEAFFRGLIQIAGAFVHLKKQYFAPLHHVDGRRLRPASRLFRLGMRNVSPYSPRHYQLELTEVLDLCSEYLSALESGDFQTNPWHPAHLPVLKLRN